MPAASARPAEPDAPCELLEWDSEHFGFPIGRVAAASLDAERLEGIEAWCDTNQVRCLYLLAEQGDAGTAELAAASGFRAVDTRVTLRREIDRISLPPLSSIAVREATEDDLAFAAELARTTRFASRFYFDDGFSDESCGRLYERWVLRGMHDPERRVRVAERDGCRAGFHVLGPLPPGGEGIAELLAVDPAHRGAGVAGELMADSIRHLADRGATSYCTVRSDRSEFTARIHERIGLLTDEVQVWHHHWFERG